MFLNNTVSKTLRVLILILVSFSCGLAQISEPTISTCSGTQYYCLSSGIFELCVEITVEAGFTQPIDEFEIVWDNGVKETVPYSGVSPISVSHTYDFSSFYGTCDFETARDIDLFTHITGSQDPLYNGTKIFVRNPPIAIFSSNNPICLNQELVLENNSCPSDGLSAPSWDYGDGAMDMAGIHTYSDTGTYQVTLSVNNPCGTATATQNVKIIENAVAQIDQLSGDVTNATICLQETLVLTGINSLFEDPNSYRWSVSGASISGPTIGEDTVYVNFSQVGFYTFTLEVDNACMLEDDIQFTVEVIDAPLLELDQTNPTCNSFDYTPEPFEPNATYTINGTVITSFPITLPVGQHNVEAVLDSGCGLQNKSIIIDVVPKISPAILTPNGSICGGDTFNISVQNTGGIWQGGGVDTLGVGYQFIPNGSGTFTLVYVTNGGTDCEMSDTVIVTVSENTDELADIQVCAGETSIVLQTVGGSFGEFSSMDCPSCIQDSLFIITNLGTLTMAEITYVSAASADCPGFSTSNLEVLNPAAALGLQDTFCFGDPIIPDDSGSTGMVSYILDGNPAVPPFNNLAEGWHTLIMEAAIADCESVDSTRFFIIPALDAPVFAVDNDEGCAPKTVLVAPVGDAADAVQYFWTVVGSGDTLWGFQPQSFVFDNTSDSDSLITLRFGSIGSCEGLFQDTVITIFPRPVAEVGYSYDNPCSGAPLIITNLSGGASDSAVWTDSFGWTYTGFDPPVQTYFTSDSFPTEVQIWVDVSNRCGMDSDTLTVIVEPTDVFAAAYSSDTTRICLGDTLLFVNISPSGIADWATSDNQTFAGDTVRIQADSTGWHSITLYIRGCGFDSVNISYFVHPLPTLTLDVEQPVCEESPVEINLQTNAVGTVLYFGVGTDSSSTQSSTYTYPAAGKYGLSAIARSTEGCLFGVADSIEVLASPTPVLAQIDSVCSGVDVSIDGQNSGNNTCILLMPNGDVLDGCSAVTVFPDAGTYDVGLIEISPEGCRDTVFSSVYVRETPRADFEVEVLEKCSPAVVKVSGQSDNATGLQWSLGDGSMSQQGIFEHTYQSGGTYSIELIATNEGICPDTAQKQIELFQTPILDLILSPNCTVLTGTNLTINTASSNYTELLAPNYQQAGNFHTGLQADEYELFIESPEGCTNDSLINILPVNELILITQPDSATILQGASVPITTTVNQTDVAYAWSNASTLDSANISSPIARPLISTDYILIATDVNGCTKSDTVHVRVFPDRDSSIFIPNIFTPDYSGFNDVFRVRCTNPSVVEIEHFSVWDKWGELMYQVEGITPDTTHGWDGFFRSKKAEQANYTYKCVLRFLDDYRLTLRGAVLLAR